MVDAISPTQGSSATYQARFAAMQQQLSQQMFQAADTDGDGVVSQSEFENFYSKFMAPSSQSPSPTTTAAADQLYQQLDTSGKGLNQTQFAGAVKQMMLEKSQSQRHQAGAGAARVAGNAASAATNHTTWFGAMLAGANQNAPAQPTASQSGGGIEFIA